MIAKNTSIEVSSKEEIVDCIQTRVYQEYPLELVTLCEQFPSDAFHDFLRISCVPYLFHKADEIYTGSEFPVTAFQDVLKRLIDHLGRVSDDLSFQHLFGVSTEKYFVKQNSGDIAVDTGAHYGNLFKEFNLSQFHEAKDLLEVRLSRNHIKLKNIEDATLLDQGCGGGRYTIAWKLLGVRKAIGLDVSEIGIEDARQKLDYLKLNNVEFVVGSVLNLPYKDETFDIVYSNGVLHHTSDWELGIREQVRVMKQGAFGWQYLIETPGGIFWDKIEILRAILKNVSKDYAKKVLGVLGVPSNRIFYMLDHVMVPINTRITPDELEESLARFGAKDIRRLKRGTDFDRVEMIYQNIPYATEKFGVGENRFVFSK